MWLIWICGWCVLLVWWFWLDCEFWWWLMLFVLENWNWSDELFLFCWLVGVWIEKWYVLLVRWLEWWLVELVVCWWLKLSEFLGWWWIVFVWELLLLGRVGWCFWVLVVVLLVVNYCLVVKWNEIFCFWFVFV